MIIKKVNIRNGGEKLPDFWERNVVYPSLSPSLCSAVPPLLHSAKLVKGLDSSTMKPCCCNRCSVWFNVILQKCARPSTRTGEFVALKPVCTFHFSNSHNRFPLCLREKRWWIKFTFGFFFAFVMNCAHRQ